jgi:hypothetical protein
MPHLISLPVATRYTSAPASNTVTAVKALHENIRSVLGGDYETFLQGSYKNDTSIPDLNDVDIVAVRKQTFSGTFSGQPVADTIYWGTIFDELQQRLDSSLQYKGKTQQRDKCVNVATGFSADVVPAVKIVDEMTDPIAIYSKSSGAERKNYPRVHYGNGVAKHQRTSERYKPTVRMFKRWCRQVLADEQTAPSFYVECLIHSFSDDSFGPDVVERFHDMASAIVGLDYRSRRIMTVAGDKDILVETDWSSSAFDTFQGHLQVAVDLVAQAIAATSQQVAEALWRRAFNE